MPNAVRGESALTLSDGRKLTLVLDMEALVEAEAAYRKPVAELMADASRGFMGASAALLQGALARHHPGMTRADALAMLQSDGDAVGDALSAASEAAFPSAEGKEPAAKRPAGKASGRSGAKQG